MIHGEVVGEIWATVKVASLTGLKLLVVRPAGDILLGSTARRPQADIVAADLVGAGVGERVIVALGKAARLALGAGENVAIEAAIIGIVDDLHLRDEPAPPHDERDGEPNAAEAPSRPRRGRGKKAPENDLGTAAPAVVAAASTVPSEEPATAEATPETKAGQAEKSMRKVAATRRPHPDPETGDLFAALEEPTPEPEAETFAAPAEAPAPASAVEKKPRRSKRAKTAEASGDADAAASEARSIEYVDDAGGPSFGDLDAIWDGPEGSSKDVEGA